MLENQIKKCSKCKQLKSLNEFSNNKNTKDGKHSHCKSCLKKYSQANKDVIAERMKEYYKENRERHKEYRQENKTAISAYQREYKEANKEMIAAYLKEYYQDNRETIATYKKEYSQTPEGKASQKNKNMRRRSTKKQGDVTTQQLIMLDKNAKVCYWCKCSLKKVKVHIDHYNPLSKGGKYTLSNLVVSCQSCNNRKHAKDPIVFANSIGRLL